jgi:hypothetical protein
MIRPERKKVRPPGEKDGQTFRREGWSDLPERRIDRPSGEKDGQTFRRERWTDLTQNVIKLFVSNALKCCEIAKKSKTF